MRKGKIYFIDPGLMDKDGHHYTYVEELSELAHLWGYEVVIYTYKTLTSDAVQSLGRKAHVIPFFTLNPFFNLKDDGEEIYALVDWSYLLAKQLAEIPQDGDWIFPTIYKQQLVALSHLKLTNRVSCLIGDTVYFKFPVFGKSIIKYIDIKLAKRSDNGIFLYSSASMVREWKNILRSSDIKVMPIPVDTKRHARKRENLKTIGIVGNWGWKFREKPEKKRVLVNVFKHLSKQYSLVLHDVVGNWNDLNNIDNVKVYSGFVENFYDLTNQCDLILLPYFNDVFYGTVGGIFDSQTYRYCLSYGIPCAVPRPLISEKYAARAGNCIAFDEFTEISILGAIQNCAMHYDVISSQAYKHSFEFRKHNGYDKLLERLISPLSP